MKRPMDEPREGRVLLEANAAIAIVLAADRGELRLLASTALEAENERNPDPIRRQRAREVMGRWRDRAIVTAAATRRARGLVAQGFRPADALHVAVAESAGADVLLTVDDRFLRSAARADLRVRVTSPVVYVGEIHREDR